MDNSVTIARQQRGVSVISTCRKGEGFIMWGDDTPSLATAADAVDQIVFRRRQHSSAELHILMTALTESTGSQRRCA